GGKPRAQSRNDNTSHRPARRRSAAATYGAASKSVGKGETHAEPPAPVPAPISHARPKPQRSNPAAMPCRTRQQTSAGAMALRRFHFHASVALIRASAEAAVVEFAEILREPCHRVPLQHSPPGCLGQSNQAFTVVVESSHSDRERPRVFRRHKQAVF